MNVRCPHCSRELMVRVEAPPWDVAAKAGPSMPARPVDPHWLVIEAVCDVLTVRPSEVVGRCRSANVSLARHCAAYVLRRRYGLSYPEIGRVLGRADHTTAMHAVARITALVQHDPRVRAAVQAAMEGEGLAAE